MSYNPDEKLIKRPQDDRPLTEWEAEEWIKCAQDKYYFFENYVWAQTPSGRRKFVPRPYQARLLDATEDHRFVVGLSQRQSGKRLCLSTIVPTPSGYTTIGDLSVGDTILGKDGKPTKVTFLSPIENNPKAYDITFSTGEIVKADAEHLWEVIEKESSGKYVKKIVDTQYMIDVGVTKSKKKNGSKEARFSIETAKPLHLPDANLPIDPYLFGYWLGDGSKSNGGIYVGEGIEGDLENLTEYCNKIGISFTVSPPSPNRSVCRVSIEGLTKSLRLLGVLNNKHIPVEYLRASKEQRILLLQGILDSDGYVGKNGRIEIKQKSKRLIDDIHELLSSLGTRFHIPREKIVKQFNPEGDAYFRIGGSLYLDDYEPFRLKRKLERVKQSPHPSRKNSIKKRQITAINSCPPVPMRCIEVDNEDHLFCIGRSFIPTHNTQSFAADILWEITFKEDYQILIGSYSNKAVLDFMTRIAYSYQELEWFLKPPAVVFNKFSIRLSNNSSVSGQTFTETFGRGTSTSRIILDELGFADKKLADEMMASLIPSISADGVNANTKLNIISTPNGTQGSFYEIWSGAIIGENNFYPVKVEYEEVPGRGPDENGVDKFKEEMMKTPGMTHDKWCQEFLCHFISSSGTLINSRFLESIEAKEAVREIGDLRVFVDSFKGRKLAIAMDPSEGIGEDYSTMQIFDIDSFEQVAEYRNNMVNQTRLVVNLKNIVEYLYKDGADDIFFSYETNGIGAGIGVLIDTLSDDKYFSNVTVISDQSRINKGKTGMVTTNKSKMEACGKFKDLVEMEKITIVSQRLINELKTFSKSGASFCAEAGNNDDLVSACLLFVRMLDEMRNYEDSVDEVVSSITLDESSDDWSDIYF